jgi:predicted molibdopterin-dependent oxidoreductase YjgC
MFKTESDHRQDGTWDESRQSVTRTVCPYCGVGCNLELRVQNTEIVGVTSLSIRTLPEADSASRDRFGWQFVQNR